MSKRCAPCARKSKSKAKRGLRGTQAEHKQFASADFKKAASSVRRAERGGPGACDAAKNALLYTGAAIAENTFGKRYRGPVLARLRSRAKSAVDNHCGCSAGVGGTRRRKRS